ncbi:MAG TPA: hypothetical protein DCL43_01540 [Chitinophagaceae bacterium]|jgi:hypothetical protein|nr:hypothetical protein [Chitinophagaceae bacterium]HAN37979.1 hypothetical protein [Chitinophagaceae bacterium]
MKQRYVAFLLFWVMALTGKCLLAQQTRDSVVQLYGVVMTADSLRGLAGVSVIVEDKGRGTITNEQGVFSIAVLKGDNIRFSSVGYKDKTMHVPVKLDGNQYSVIQLMVNDTAFLPATILKPRPTRMQFERDFVNTEVAADQYEIARQNTDEAKRRILLASLPADGREAFNMQMRTQSAKYYSQGQQAPINLFNPIAWNEFIKAWKRGDFKKKRS